MFSLQKHKVYAQKVLVHLILFLFFSLERQIHLEYLWVYYIRFLQLSQLHFPRCEGFCVFQHYDNLAIPHIVQGYEKFHILKFLPFPRTDKISFPRTHAPPVVVYMGKKLSSRIFLDREKGICLPCVIARRREAPLCKHCLREIVRRP